MSITSPDENTRRQVCGWCCRYARHPDANGFCSDTCRDMFDRYGMSRLALQLKYDVFAVTGGLFRKSCRWCFGFFETADPAVRFCSAEHEDLYVENRRRSLAQVLLDEYEPERAEARMKRGFVRLACAWCGARFEGRKGSRFCCERHQRLARRHGGTQSAFYEKFNILSEEDGGYRKRCQCCGTEFLTANITQENCSEACNKLFAKHGRLSNALVAKKRTALAEAKASGVRTPFGQSVLKAVIGGDDADWREKVEWVVRLPADQRFAFTKDWTDRERDYARRLLHDAPGASRKLDDAGLTALAAGVEDLDAAY